MGANEIFDSSVSCTGNEESLRERIKTQTCSSCMGVAYAVNHF